MKIICNQATVTQQTEQATVSFLSNIVCVNYVPITRYKCTTSCRNSCCNAYYTCEVIINQTSNQNFLNTNSQNQNCCCSNVFNPTKNLNLPASTNFGCNKNCCSNNLFAKLQCSLRNIFIQ